MTETAKTLRKKLRDAGLSKAAIDAAWPTWWSEEAASSLSAQAELRFAVSRKLGLSARSLFDEGDATFVWEHNAKFKSYTGGTHAEQAAIVSFATSFARLILSARTDDRSFAIPAASELRKLFLGNKGWIDLERMLAGCWSMGIPVVHLRVVPLSAKRMAAMAVRVGNQPVILLAKDYNTPAPIGFYLGHELGHLALGHVDDGDVLIDMGNLLDSDSDAEEKAADEYALELLTGTATPEIDTGDTRVIGTNLALAASIAAPQYRVEPGMIALCYGHQSGNWRATWAALNQLYPKPAPAWQFVNAIAQQQLDLTKVSSDSADYIRAIMGLA
jgi:hypothetical protein